MSATNTIKNALITDLQTIAGIGDVLKVPTKIEDTDFGTTGAIGIISTRGGSELDALNDVAGQTAQIFELQLAVKDNADPNTASDDLLDAVRNACETGASAVRALTGGGMRVEQVTVTDWTAVETAEQIAEGVFIRDAEISVIYYYGRGSV